MVQTFVVVARKLVAQVSSSKAGPSFGDSEVGDNPPACASTAVLVRTAIEDADN